MTTKFLFISITLFAIGSCKENNFKRILIDNQFAEGDIKISKDTVFNGIIKYYDTATNNLKSESNYINDTLIGKSTNYYSNGDVMHEIYYEKGKENGYGIGYDASGDTLFKQYYYHGLEVGPYIEYRHNKPKIYRYYSFDRIMIFKSNIDNFSTDSAELLSHEYFFITSNPIIDDLDNQNIKREYFVYLINPTNPTFEYSFITVDSFKKETKTIKHFDSNKFWETFTISSAEKAKRERFAFKLDIYDKGDLIKSTINILD